MGTLYRETVEYKKQRLVKVILTLGLLVLTLNTVVLLSDLRNLVVNFLFVVYAIFPFAILCMAHMWFKYRRRYRYTIIDRELIIEKLKGTKRKPILNVNAKHIVRIERVSSVIKGEKLYKVFNCSCSGKKSSVYHCIYEKDGKMYGFYFEPSGELINKIYSLCSKKEIA
jgi:hypothetical protein